MSIEMISGVVLGAILGSMIGVFVSGLVCIAVNDLRTWNERNHD